MLVRPSSAIFSQHHHHHPQVDQDDFLHHPPRLLDVQAPPVYASPPPPPSSSQRQPQVTITAASSFAAPQGSASWESTIAEQIHIRSLNHAAVASSAVDDGESNRRHPYMVAVVGAPGSGKSTSAEVVAKILETRYGLRAAVLPHDGYHYPMDYLRARPDADELIYRRGAADTFDPRALARDLHRIRYDASSTEPSSDRIAIPGFDHAKGDPTPGEHVFDRKYHQVVIVEGLYLLHDGDGWEDVKTYFDLSVLINTDLEVCMDRVKKRNTCIPGYTPEEIAVRVERVDRRNAATVLRSKARADIVVNPTASPSAIVSASPSAPSLARLLSPSSHQNLLQMHASTAAATTPSPHPPRHRKTTSYNNLVTTTPLHTSSSHQQHRKTTSYNNLNNMMRLMSPSTSCNHLCPSTSHLSLCEAGA